MNVPKIVIDVYDFLKSKNHECMKVDQNGTLVWCQKDICETVLILKTQRVFQEFIRILEKRGHCCIFNQIDDSNINEYQVVRRR